MEENKYKLKLKMMPLAERPREKLILAGPKGLNDSELLAIILGSGSAKEDVIQVSKTIIQKDTLRALSTKRIPYFKECCGVGDAKAAKIVAAFELGRRIASFKEGKKKKISCAKDVARIFIPKMSVLNKEILKCAFLDSRKNMIKEETIFIGNLNTSVIHPREIFNAAIQESACAIIVLHNHPSGDPEPSEEDVEVTKRLVKSGEMLGIPVLDHIIIGSRKYYSFNENGLV